ncbi:MAG: rhodanese-like domain-containing protein [Verrucomicrobiota bacterium JB022]|nr:rhodanese-like domain-containing protein [Verrucomicrobiota bacterium JB022]
MKSLPSRFLLLAALATTAPLGWALTVEELADAIVAGDAPVVIDLRPTTLYQQGHIPGAISIPLPLLAQRQLPPFGEVVVYADGFGRQDAAEAVRLLSQKKGIEPDLLEGGYAAWQTRSGVTTEPKGMTQESPPTISYQELQGALGEDVVIYDLRASASARPLRASAVAGTTSAPEPESLSQHFPQAQVRRGNPLQDVAGRASRPAPLRASASQATTASNPLLKSGGSAASPLIVLVDDDNQSAVETARQLRAAGYERVAVLAGGETILQYDGRSGTDRRSGGTITDPTAEPQQPAE